MPYKNPKDAKRRSKEYYQEHKKKIKKYTSEYQKKNKDKVKEWHRRYYQRHKEDIRKQHKEYRGVNKVKEKRRYTKYYQKNKKIFLKKTGDYRRKHKEKYVEYSKKYRQKHRETVLRRQRNYRRNNLEKCRERVRKYLKTPKGKLAEFKKHSVRREKLPFKILEKDIRIILQRDKVCVYCGSDKKLGIDHINPNGSTTISNLVLCCQSCNSSKQTKNVLDWCEYRGINVPTVVNRLVRDKIIPLDSFLVAELEAHEPK